LSALPRLARQPLPTFFTLPQHADHKRRRRREAAYALTNLRAARWRRD